MKRWLILILLILIAHLASPTLPAAERLVVELERGYVTAGDLAAVAPIWKRVPEDAVLSRAPLPGIERRVTAAQMARWALDYGLDAAPGEFPSALVVKRRMRLLGGEEARRLIVAAVAEQNGVSPESVKVDLPAYRPAPVPSGELRFRLTSKLHALNRPTRLHLGWEREGERSGQVALDAVVRIRARLWTAARDLPARTELSAEDLVLREIDLPATGGNFLGPDARVLGAVLRSPAARGEPIRGRALAFQPAVKRGELIELQVRFRTLRLRTSARAEQSGEIGDRISCRNLQSNRRVTAVVAGRKLAEVRRLR